jgi:proline iminopeptidase
MFKRICFAIMLSSISVKAYAEFSTPVKKFQSNSDDLTFHSIGAVDAPIAILLGGGPGFSSWNLEPIQKQLANNGWHVALMDMRGIGENKQALNNSLESVNLWVQDIEALRTHLQRHKITLIGHSWGALMAMLYARKYPENIHRMILLNPVDPEKSGMQALTENIHLRNLQELNQNWDDEAAWDNTTEIETSEQALERMTLKQITQVLPTYFFDYQKGIEYSKKFSAADFNIDLNINTWKAYDADPISFQEINSWAFPIDFVECQQDPLMPYNLNAMEPNMTFASINILKNCGHFPWVEQTKEFNKVLKVLSEIALNKDK